MEVCSSILASCCNDCCLVPWGRWQKNIFRISPPTPPFLYPPSFFLSPPLSVKVYPPSPTPFANVRISFILTSVPTLSEGQPNLHTHLTTLHMTFLKRKCGSTQGLNLDMVLRVKLNHKAQCKSAITVGFRF